MDDVQCKQTQAVFTLSGKAVITIYTSLWVRNSAFLSNLVHNARSEDNWCIAGRLTGGKLICTGKRLFAFWS